MWIVWATTCSVLHAVSSAMMKRVVERSPLLASTILSVAFGFPVYVVLIAVTGVPDIRPGFVPALLAGLVLNIITIPLRNLALRISPLSLTIPYLAFTPLFLLATEALMLGDRPGVRGTLGVVLIVIGAFVLQFRGGPLGISEAFRGITRERGSLIMLGVAALWSVTSVLDKICVLASSPVFYLVVFDVLYVVGSLPILVAKRRPLLPTARREWRPLAAIAALHIGTVLAQMVAIRLTLVSYVIAIKRAGMLLSVVIGAVFFGERPLRQRLLGAMVMSAGVALVLTGCSSRSEKTLGPGPGPGPGSRIIRIPADFASIQEGLDAADPGDTVLVASGTYNLAGDRDLTFRGKNVVLRSEAGTQATVIDCMGGGRGFVIDGGESEAAVIAGFTILAGEAPGAPAASRPGAGGGMYCGKASPTVIDCRFSRNHANLGGGVYCDSLSAPTFRRCIFTSNSAVSGGALFCNSASPLIEECTFTGNTASTLGGGLAAIGYSSPTLERCLIALNSAGQSGGGVFVFGFTSSKLEVIGCTFAENVAVTGGGGGGLYLRGAPSVTLANTIIAFSARSNAVTCAAGDPVTLRITCSDIFGNPGGDWEGCIADQAGMSGNISEDPLFCAAGIGDYRLTPESPCAPANSGTCRLIGALAEFGACNPIPGP